MFTIKEAGQYFIEICMYLEVFLVPATRWLCALFWTGDSSLSQVVLLFFVLDSLKMGRLLAWICIRFWSGKALIKEPNRSTDTQGMS